MSVLEGIPNVTPATRAFVQTVRGYTRDHAELNRLVGGEESDDRQILWAVYDALSDFNGTPPFLGRYRLEDLLMRDQHALLLRMTVIALIESVGLLQTRNHINYSDGGLNVGVNDKTPLLMKWLEMFKSMTEQRKLQVKVALNIEPLLNGGPGGVHSELWWVNMSFAGYA